MVVVAIRLLSIAAGLALVKSYTGELSIAEVGRFFYLSTLSYALNALVFVPVDFYMQARLARRAVRASKSTCRAACGGLFHSAATMIAWRRSAESRLANPPETERQP